MVGRFLGVVLALAAVSCSSGDTPSGSSNTSGESSSTDPTSLRDLTPYTEAEVQSLMSDRRHACTECHYAGSIHDMDLTRFATATIGVAPRASGVCGKSAFEFRIAPGDRNRSLLWAKVKGSHDCGGKMPGRGEALDDVEVERLGLYIDSLGKSPTQ